MKATNISLGEKEYLNPSEAAAYWNLSRRKFFRFLKEGPYEFMALYGNRKLIIRTAFDKYLKVNPSVKKALANGVPNVKKTKVQKLNELKTKITPILIPDKEDEAMLKIPLKEKYMLTIREAAVYFDMSAKKIRQLAEEHTDTFGVYNGNRYRIIRSKFEEYLQENPTI